MKPNCMLLVTPVNKWYVNLFEWVRDVMYLHSTSIIDIYGCPVGVYSLWKIVWRPKVRQSSEWIHWDSSFTRNNCVMYTSYVAISAGMTYYYKMVFGTCLKS